MLIDAMRQYKQVQTDKTLSALMAACVPVAKSFCMRYRIPGTHEDVLQESWQAIVKATLQYELRTEDSCCNLIYKTLRFCLPVRHFRGTEQLFNDTFRYDMFESLSKVLITPSPEQEYLAQEAMDACIKRAIKFLSRRRRRLCAHVEPYFCEMIDGESAGPSTLDRDILDVAIRWAAYTGDRFTAKTIFNHVAPGTL
jgi:hypothetical protein